MTCQCSDVGLSEIFTERVARKDARRYLRHGLPPRARRLKSCIEASLDLRNRTTLEIGSGVGAFTVELARSGTTHSQGVDATLAVVNQAKRVAQDKGVSDRVSFEVADFTAVADGLEPADLVLLDRVVCCYPDWQALLQPAAAHARHAIALSYPADTGFTRAVVRTLNTGQALLRRKFRMHLHPPPQMHQLLRNNGFDIARLGRYWTWELMVAVRRPAGAPSGRRAATPPGR